MQSRWGKSNDAVTGYHQRMSVIPVQGSVDCFSGVFGPVRDQGVMRRSERTSRRGELHRLEIPLSKTKSSILTLSTNTNVVRYPNKQ
jgi:hypothetical protein